ncbi:glycosyltransferase family 39 protein [Thiomicrorhabdus sp. Milos-T2]|uniref:glycosyltransferase family 39 protein n=1 Tax=Thiomicrorhabdus sp. Milos-T2 TaxID=90814 RepID=UPI000493C504|nr:glycosyltransferase family 39 protein [Thiomicrorhabdus sp. Milos-T2]
MSKPSLLGLFWQQLNAHQQALIIAFVLLKIALILLVPLTGDEAYFITWGQNLSLGYYDHPPAVGWVLYGLSQVADNLVWYRSFAFLSAVLIAYLLYKLATLNDLVNQTNAIWLALAFFVSPISLMFVVTANDTVLVLFSVLGVYFFAKTIHTQSWQNTLLAGLFLGLAFLSKYFAAFMLLGLFAYSVWFWKKINLKHWVFIVFIVLLAVAENLYFNATHCWNNILFNFFSRTEQSHFEWQNVLSFIGMIGLLLSPLGLWYLVKFKSQVESFESAFLNPITVVLFASIPLLLILFMVSFTNTVGLHWPLLSVTLLYVLYIRLSKANLKKLFVFNAYFSLIIALIILVALGFVNQLISPSQQHHVAVYSQPEKVCKYLPKESPFFTLGYSSQSALAYHCGNDNVHVFASVSKFGREDDKLTNFKELSKQDLKILITQEKDVAKVSPYFDSLHAKPIKIDESTSYFLIDAKGFNYALYREQVLTKVNDKFYTAPDWFPVIKKGCEFKQKYNFN